MASSGNQFRLWAARAAQAATGNIVITDAAGGSSKFSGKIPIFRDAYSAVTTLVTQDDEALDVQAIVGAPFSPLATTITISGANVSLFDKIAGGKLVIKASARASITKDTTYALTVNASNAAGASETCTWNIYVAADADCRFVSFGSGSDAAAGTSPATAWKHCPDTLDWTGSATTLTGGKSIFFEGVDRGQKHATSLIKSVSPYNEGPLHAGTSGKAQRYCFYGWGGQAKFTGADDISGSWTSAASGDIYTSGITGVEKITLSTAGEFAHIVSFGETQGVMAQYPRPNTLSQACGFQAALDNTNNYDNTAGTSDGGMKRIYYTTNTADATTPKYCKPATGLHFVEDAKLDARFNNQNWTFAANGVGVWLYIVFAGNNGAYVRVQQYDATLHRAYFAATTGTPVNQGGYTAYALLGSPYDVQVSTQYAFAYDGLTVLAKRPNSNQAVIARRGYGLGFGLSAYCTWHQPWAERYVLGLKRDGTDPADGGAAAVGASPSGVAGLKVHGLRAHQCFNTNETACLLDAKGVSSGFVDFIFDRFHQTECLHGAGAVINVPLKGLQTGSTPQGGPTAAELMAYSLGKARWWYFADDSASRSLVTCNQIKGVEFIEPVIGHFVTVHGDGFPWYMDVAGSYSNHNLIRNALGIGVERWRTSSSATSVDHTIPLNNTFLNCVVLGIFAGNYGVDLYDGDTGAVYQQCIFVNDASDASAHQCFKGGSGFANMTLLNCVANGVYMTTGLGPSSEAATWTLDTCYFTGDSTLDGAAAVSVLTDNPGASRRVLSCTRGTTKMTWDYGTMPSDWVTTLQKGATAGTTKIGPFHYV